MIFVLADNPMEAEQLINLLQDTLNASVEWKWVRTADTLRGQERVTILEAPGWRTRARMKPNMIWAQEIIQVARALRIRLWLNAFEHGHYFG